MIENRQETPQRSIMKRATTLKADLKNVQNKIAGFREVEKTLGKTPQKVGDFIWALTN